jgi:hypothetical protein
MRRREMWIRFWGLMVRVGRSKLRRRYEALRVRELTGASFEQYLAAPAHYDFAARALLDGKGLRLDARGGIAAVVR